MSLLIAIVLLIVATDGRPVGHGTAPWLAWSIAVTALGTAVVLLETASKGLL